MTLLFAGSINSWLSYLRSLWPRKSNSVALILAIH
jgi:hypothetical protein